MKRKAIHYESNLHDTTRIYLDQANASVLLRYTNRWDVEEEFKEIRKLIKEGTRNRERYCKANVSAKARSIFEMRFTNRQHNDRIYCMEQSVGRRRHVVMIELYENKKTQFIPQNIKSRMETMGGYVYEY